MKFLLVAKGYDKGQSQWSNQVSQLAVSLEELTLDSVITHWASAQIGGIKHIVALQKETMCLANLSSNSDMFDDYMGYPQDHLSTGEAEDMQG